MARKNRRRSKPATSNGDTQNPTATKSLGKYDMITSHRNLMKDGFHPAVTSKSPEEIEKAWVSKLEGLLTLPTQEEFMGKPGQGEPSLPLTYLTTAMLLFRYETRHNGKDINGTNMLAKIVNAVDIGCEVANFLFAHGWRTVLHAAVTSSSSWSAIANSARIWDFYASDLRTNGLSGVLLAVTPEHTVGEMNMAYDMDPYGLNPGCAISSWCADAKKVEREIYLSIYLIHGRASGGRYRKKHSKYSAKEIRDILPVDFLAEEIVSTVRSVQDVARIWGSCQFTSSPQHYLFEPQAVFSAVRLKSLLEHISQQRSSYQVLYFQKIPYLDRRVIAIILRACPLVRMVGIYDCPLIHFGDVLCLIDLIYEINYNRRQAALPEITAFDFYPAYQKGTPFTSDTTATYGLTWGPQKLDVVQRGFFNIILKAFMKAKRMKLDLLFDKDKAFCDYLHQVPNYPLAVPTFLDAMHRLLETKEKECRKRALYDLLKPVRIGLENRIDHDWPKWYMDVMGRCMVFCSSCGFETNEEFYGAFAREMPPTKRVCSGCTLQSWLDGEPDHLKRHKKQILDTLCPNWNGLQFNADAPLPQAINQVIKLRSTESTRTEEQHIAVDSNGEMYGRRVTAALVRDNKMHYDSLQNLPTLTELTGRRNHKTWGHFFNKCNNLDVYCRIIRRIREENDGEAMPLIKTRIDGGMPDHVEELQPPKPPTGGVPSNDFVSAAALYIGLTMKGWAGSQS
ncbi:hypothetical protein QQS21_007307 [Conoideocrella luteorostrata]|uniref:Uncharacterized protein n=1 Tax=Conoideocrella luteorostrata TaxID=1105319 RepID=A0AAJ0CLD4_9HYPO|nr:hypothetical protein QQS21_007307 [Conoideocrella luteorostrata]